MRTARDVLDRYSLVAPLRGRVLEIGPGRGANLAYLRRDVEWIGLEPAARKHRAIRSAARQLGRRIQLHQGGAESIPLPDASLDGVLATFVLCSVRDVPACLAEIRRVLRPGAPFVFLEHVAAPDGSRTRRLQNAWARVPVGRCRPNRRTAAAIEGAGFAGTDYTSPTARGLFGLRVPLIRGTATR